MKKIFAFLMVFIFVFSLFPNVYAAPNYGEEWNNLAKTTTNTFSDVNSDHWAYDAVMRVVEKKWFNGYPSGKFKPDGSITRAEALKVFVVFLGLEISDVEKSTYYDVDIDAWYAPYIEAGKDLFPTHTTIQGKTPFQPDMPVTREDTVYALVRALGYDIGVKYNDQSILNMFTDQDSISSDLKKYLTIALEEGLVSGFPDDTIRAQDSLTRAEFATLLYRGSFKGNSGRHEAKISSVSVTPSKEIELEIGEEINLSARATYTDGTNKPYDGLDPYIVSNNGVIKLSGTKITALKAGTTSIKYNDEFLKDETLEVVVNTPSAAPKLKITDYDEVTEEASAVVKGTVIDKSGGEIDLICNAKDISVKSSGAFTATVKLNVGINEIEFVATNKYGNETKKTIKIERIEKEPETEYPAEDKEIEPTITSVVVRPSDTLRMVIGEKIDLSAEAIYTDGSRKIYSDLSPYPTDGKEIISVIGNKVFANKAGTSSIKFDSPYLKSKILTVIVVNPATAPTIEIFEYDEITSEEKVEIYGHVSDEAGGDVTLEINGKYHPVQTNGNFGIFNVKLNPGKNTISFVARNEYGVKTSKTITITYEPKTPKYEMGDLNFDGVVNEIDVNMLTKILANDGSVVVNDKIFAVADMNKDGKLSVTDLSQLIKKINSK